MKYVTIKWEAKQNIIANAAFDIKKGEITSVPDKFVLSEDMIAFKSAKEAEEYVKKRPPEISTKEPEIEEHFSDITDKVVDDYLNRNANTVIKALKRDNISKEFVTKLLDMEKKNKKRKKLIKFMEGMLYGSH